MVPMRCAGGVGNAIICSVARRRSAWMTGFGMLLVGGGEGGMSIWSAWARRCILDMSTKSITITVMSSCSSERALALTGRVTKGHGYLPWLHSAPTRLPCA